MSKIKSELKTENSVQRGCIDKIEHKRKSILWWQHCYLLRRLKSKSMVQLSCVVTPTDTPTVLRVKSVKKSHLSQFIIQTSKANS